MANAPTFSSQQIRQQLSRTRESALFSKEQRPTASSHRGKFHTERKVSEPLPLRKNSASFDLVSAKNAKRYSDVTRPTPFPDCADEPQFDQTFEKKESSGGYGIDLERTRRLIWVLRSNANVLSF